MSFFEAKRASRIFLIEVFGTETDSNQFLLHNIDFFLEHLARL
jgi:hypothetical protein